MAPSSSSASSRVLPCFRSKALALEMNFDEQLLNYPISRKQFQQQLQQKHHQWMLVASEQMNPRAQIAFNMLEKVIEMDQVFGEILKKIRNEWMYDMIEQDDDDERITNKDQNPYTTQRQSEKIWRMEVQKLQNTLEEYEKSDEKHKKEIEMLQEKNETLYEAILHNETVIKELHEQLAKALKFIHQNGENHTHTQWKKYAAKEMATRIFVDEQENDDEKKNKHIEINKEKEEEKSITDDTINDGITGKKAMEREHETIMENVRERDEDIGFSVDPAAQRALEILNDTREAQMPEIQRLGGQLDIRKTDLADGADKHDFAAHGQVQQASKMQHEAPETSSHLDVDIVIEKLENGRHEIDKFHEQLIHRMESALSNVDSSHRVSSVVSRSPKRHVDSIVSSRLAFSEATLPKAEKSIHRENLSRLLQQHDRISAAQSVQEDEQLQMTLHKLRRHEEQLQHRFSAMQASLEKTASSIAAHR